MAKYDLLTYLKPVTSLATINSWKPIAPNRTKITRSGLVSKKNQAGTLNNVKTCWARL